MRKVCGKFLLILSYLIPFGKSRKQFRSWVFVSVMKNQSGNTNKPGLTVTCYKVAIPDKPVRQCDDENEKSKETGNNKKVL